MGKFVIQDKKGGPMQEDIFKGEILKVRTKMASGGDAAFRKSALMRDKWDSKRGASTYGAQTIDKAIEATEERTAIQAENKNATNVAKKSETGSNIEPTRKAKPKGVTLGEPAGCFDELHCRE